MKALLRILFVVAVARSWAFASFFVVLCPACSQLVQDGVRAADHDDFEPASRAIDKQQPHPRDNMEVTDVLKLLSDHPEGTFLEFSRFNDHTFGTCDFTGVAPGWEMHPDTDEFFYVLSGCVEITLLEDSGPEHHVAPAGTSFVVPRGVWHRPGAPEGARFIFFTPGESLFSESEDPRLDQDGWRHE